MQALIIYYSLTGRTAQAAKFIAKGLEAENIVVTRIKATDATLEDLAQKDLIVFGTPVHVGAPAMALRRFLNKLPEGALTNKKVAIFATYTLWGSESAMETVMEIVRDKGATNEIPKVARRGSFVRSLWNVISGSTDDEEAWVAFGKQLTTI